MERLKLLALLVIVALVAVVAVSGCTETGQLAGKDQGIVPGGVSTVGSPAGEPELDAAVGFVLGPAVSDF